MKTKHLSAIILALLIITTNFPMYGMLVRSLALSSASLRQRGAKYSQINGVTKYDAVRDESNIVPIAAQHMEKLMSDVTEHNQKEMLENIMSSFKSNNHTMVYLIDNKAVGFIQYGLSQSLCSKVFPRLIGPNAIIQMLAVDNEHQGKGIGTHLLEYALKDCNNRFVNKVTLKTTDYHLAAYYHKFGFKHIRGSKYTGVDEFSKQLQPYPAMALYLMMVDWLYKNKK